MTSGGGAGRMYRPSANAAIARIAITAKGRAKLLPNRRAQASQSVLLSRARQLLLFICAPHSAQ